MPSPSYDDDGNTVLCPLSSGLWSFTWNAENRMVSAESASTRLEFVYDYMGRRVRKKVFTGSPGAWTLVTDALFVYDGYLQIEELDALNSNAILKKRVWELGGNRLLSETALSPTPYTVYALSDANKNITEYIDSTGVIQAHFEYLPFGKMAKSSGPMAGDFNYEFSSEYSDSETEMIYYNFRYYSPELGRWMSRDPIGEEGGYNLYAMAANDTINWWDWLGFTDDCMIQLFVGHANEVETQIGILNYQEINLSKRIEKENEKIDRENERNSKKRKGGKPIPHKQLSQQRGAMAVSCYPDKMNEQIIETLRDPDSKGLLDEFLEDISVKNEKGEIIGKVKQGLPFEKLKEATLEALDHAKKRASALCDKPPACCKKIEIKVICGGKPMGTEASEPRSTRVFLGDKICTSHFVDCPKQCPSK